MIESTSGKRLAGFELPTAKAELTILLMDANGRAGPVRWQSRRSLLARWVDRLRDWTATTKGRSS